VRRGTWRRGRPIVARDAQVGSGVRFGAHVVVHPGVRIGDGCQIQDGAVLGKPPLLGRHSRARAQPQAVVTALGEGASVCAGAILVAGAIVDEHAVVGDHVFLRERAHLGAESVIGHGGAVGPDAQIGRGARLMNNALVPPASIVEEGVFVGPNLTATNDRDMGRHEPGAVLPGMILRRACRLGGGVVLLPGVEIGEEAAVAAGAVVTAPVAPRTLVAGVPARVLREVRDDELLERWRPGR
jgi:acetyltransferase-like isoleucine patch superfamily enzyme